MKMLKGLWSKHQRPLPTADVITRSQQQQVTLRPPLVEVKHRVTKSSQSFTFQNWTCPHSIYCVGRWISTGEQSYGSPKNSYSWGVWATNGLMTNIGAYRLHDCYGNLLAYRLDIVKEVSMRKTITSSVINDVIEFQDMIVDCWLWPNNKFYINSEEILVEDLEEFCLINENKLLVEEDGFMVNDTLDMILSEPNIVIDVIDEAITEACNYIS